MIPWIQSFDFKLVFCLFGFNHKIVLYIVLPFVSPWRIKILCCPICRFLLDYIIFIFNKFIYIFYTIVSDLMQSSVFLELYWPRTNYSVCMCLLFLNIFNCFGNISNFKQSLVNLSFQAQQTYPRMFCCNKCLGICDVWHVAVKMLL